MTITSAGLSISAGPVFLTQDVDGIAVIPDTPLTWTNFFDGRPMRATDFTAEQQAGIDHTRLTARAGGVGVSWGYDVVRPSLTKDQAGETLRIEPGLAIDPDGRALCLTQRIEMSIPELLAATTQTTHALGTQSGDAAFAPCVVQGASPVAASPSGTLLYLLTIGWIQGRCGYVEVFGSACGGARGGSCGGGCTHSSDRPFRIDGVIFRLRPLTLRAAWELSGDLSDRHLRSRVAAAVFADEQESTRWPLSAALLASARWRGGTQPPVGAVGSEVPLAVIARRGGVTLFDDVWAARRERTDAPSRPAFDARITARPRAIFAAQLDQFQAQLAGVGAELTIVSADQLFNAGFVELPSAGFLPVDPGRPLTDQCAALFGSQVSVQLVPVPKDQIPHEMEAAAHRDRIPLRTLTPEPSPQVDVLVPDGTRTGGLSNVARLFALEATLTQSRAGVAAGGNHVRAIGAGRRVDRADGGLELYAAAIAGVSNASDARAFVMRLAEPAQQGDPLLVARNLDGDLIDLVADHAAAAAQRLKSDRIDARIIGRRLDAQQGKPIVAWTELRTDIAPWRAAEGRPVKVEWALEVSAPAGQEGVTTTVVTASGQLIPRQPSTPTTRLWTFTGSLSVVSKGAVRHKEARVNVDQVRSDAVWKFNIADAGTISLSPDATPAERIDLELSTAFTMALLLAPAVADPADTYRAAGERSLSVLRLAPPVDEREYQQRRTELFGNDSDAGLPAVTGPYDWVAFRRRPGSSPTPVPSPAVPTPPPVVTVEKLQVAVRTVTDAAEIVAAAQEMTTEAGSPSAMLTITFEPGSAELAGDSKSNLRAEAADAVQSLEKAEIHLIGFAPVDLSLGAERAQATVDALAGIAAPASGTTARTVSIDKGDLGDSIGKVVLLAGPPRLRPRLDFVSILQREVADQWDELVKELTNDDATLLARAVEEKPGLVVLSQPLPAFAPDVKKLRDQLAHMADRWVLLEVTPILLLDKEWATQDPDAAKLAQEAAEQILDGLTTPQASLALRSEHRPGLAAGLSRAIVVLLRLR